MGQKIIIPGADFSNDRSALKVTNFPPYIADCSLYTPSKLTSERIINPFDAESTDLIPVPSFAMPTLWHSTTFNKDAFFFANPPTTRISIRRPINASSFTLHFHFAFNTAPNVNSHLFSIISTDKQRAVKMWAASQATSKATIKYANYTPGWGNIPGANTPNWIYQEDLTYTPNTSQKEFITFIYNNGAAKVYRDAALITTIAAQADFAAFDGFIYLGAETFSGTNASDFKGAMPLFLMYEYEQTPEQITEIYNWANA